MKILYTSMSEKVSDETLLTAVIFFFAKKIIQYCVTKLIKMSMDLENGTEVYASTFLKLNIYRDCDFINKYLMTRYDKRNYLHRYDMFIIIYLSLCHVMFTFTCTGVAWCLWTQRS